MCIANLEGLCVEVGLYPGRVHPVWQGPLLELLPGVGSPGEQGEGGLQVTRGHRLGGGVRGHRSRAANELGISEIAPNSE